MKPNLRFNFFAAVVLASLCVLAWRSGAPRRSASVGAPYITTLEPPAITAGAPDFRLTVTGSNFGTDSIVKWNGRDKATDFISNYSVQALIPALDVSAIGSARVTVFNSGPAGGLSNELIFTIQPRGGY